MGGRPRLSAAGENRLSSGGFRSAWQRQKASAVVFSGGPMDRSCLAPEGRAHVPRTKLEAQCPTFPPDRADKASDIALRHVQRKCFRQGIILEQHDLYASLRGIMNKASNAKPVLKPDLSVFVDRKPKRLAPLRGERGRCRGSHCSHTEKGDMKRMAAPKLVVKRGPLQRCRRDDNLNLNS